MPRDPIDSESFGLQLLVSTLGQDSSSSEDEFDDDIPSFSSDDASSPRQHISSQRRRPHYPHEQDARFSVLSTSTSSSSNTYLSSAGYTHGRKGSFASTSTAPTVYSLDVPNGKRSSVLSDASFNSLEVPNTKRFSGLSDISLNSLDVPNSKRFSTLSDNSVSSLEVPDGKRFSVLSDMSRTSIVISEPGNDGDDESSSYLPPRTYEFPLPGRRPSAQADVLLSASSVGPRRSSDATFYNHGYPSVSHHQSMANLRGSKSRQELKATRSSSRAEFEVSASSSSGPSRSLAGAKSHNDLRRKISWLTQPAENDRRLSPTPEYSTLDRSVDTDEIVLDDYHKHASITSKTPASRILIKKRSSKSKNPTNLQPKPPPTYALPPTPAPPSAPNPLQDDFHPHQFEFPRKAPQPPQPPRLTKQERLTGEFSTHLNLWKGPQPRRVRSRTASSDCIDVQVESRIRQVGASSSSSPPAATTAGGKMVPAMKAVKTVEHPAMPAMQTRDWERSAPAAAPAELRAQAQSSGRTVNRKMSYEVPPPRVMERRGSRNMLAEPEAMKIERRIRDMRSMDSLASARGSVRGRIQELEGRDRVREMDRERQLERKQSKPIMRQQFWDADSFGGMVLPGLPATGAL